jgi:hypothetical protein
MDNHSTRIPTNTSRVGIYLYCIQIQDTLCQDICIVRGVTRPWCCVENPKSHSLPVFVNTKAAYLWCKLVGTINRRLGNEVILRGFRSTMILRSVDWYVVTCVSKQSVSSIIKSQVTSWTV